MNWTAVILAGGRSSRMGCDKAFLKIDGQTLLARQVEIVKEAGASEVFISGRMGVDYSLYGLPVVRDEFPNSGPLAGIHAAMAMVKTPLLLVLAVDMPHLSRQLVQRLLTFCGTHQGAIPYTKWRMEPLVALYPEAAKPLAAALLQSGNNAVSAFAEQCVQAQLAQLVSCEEEEYNCFENWNSPADTGVVAKFRPKN